MGKGKGKHDDQEGQPNYKAESEGKGSPEGGKSKGGKGGVHTVSGGVCDYCGKSGRSHETRLFQVET